MVIFLLDKQNGGSYWLRAWLSSIGTSMHINNVFFGGWAKELISINFTVSFSKSRAKPLFLYLDMAHG